MEDPHAGDVRLWNLLDRILAEGDRRKLLAALATIEAARVHLHDRLRTPLDSKPETPSLLGAQQIAKLTGLSARFFYENGDAPFAIRISARRLRFDLEKFLEWRKHLERGG